MTRRTPGHKKNKRVIMIKVIGFDLDDTLWDVKPVIIKAEQTLDSWLKQSVPGLKYDVVTMREFRHDVLAQKPELAKQITEFRRHIILHALIESNVDNPDQVSTEAIEVFLRARNQIEFFTGAIETLNSLNETYTLGALSNGNADVHRLGLSDVFDFAFSAEDVGEPKPGLALFLRALEHTGVSAENMVYVGDDPLLDVAAASQAGLKTVWLDSGKKPAGDCAPDQIINDIRELPRAIEALHI